VLAAKSDYPKYKLKTNPDGLDAYLAVRTTDQFSALSVLNYLISDENYHFNILLESIESIIQGNNILENNFKPIFDAYKLLSDKKPLPVQLNANQRNIIWNTVATKPNTPAFSEIIAMQIANGQNNGGTFDDEQIKEIAAQMDYYVNYGDLLINNLSRNIPVLGRVLKYMTENKLGHKLSLEKVLPKFFDIKTNINVTEAQLLAQLNRWNKFSDSITKDNVNTTLPVVKFFQYSATTKNQLTDYLNKTIIEALTIIPTTTLYQQKASLSTYYWFVVIKDLIDTEFLKSLPDNLTELGKLILDDIAGGKQPIPNNNDLFNKIITKLDKRKTGSLIKDIRDKYCNRNYIMSVPLFMYFESWFEQQGDLSVRAADATHKIIEPVINDTNCLNLIVSKQDYYAQIINYAGDDAIALKEIIRKKITNSRDEKLIQFASKIDVAIESKMA
jgi:hypothetical protein